MIDSEVATRVYMIVTECPMYGHRCIETTKGGQDKRMQELHQRCRAGRGGLALRQRLCWCSASRDSRTSLQESSWWFDIILCEVARPPSGWALPIRNQLLSLSIRTTRDTRAETTRGSKEWFLVGLIFRLNANERRERMEESLNEIRIHFGTRNQITWRTSDWPMRAIEFRIKPKRSKTFFFKIVSWYFPRIH